MQSTTEVEADAMQTRQARGNVHGRPIEGAPRDGGQENRDGTVVTTVDDSMARDNRVPLRENSALNAISGTILGVRANQVST